MYLALSVDSSRSQLASDYARTVPIKEWPSEQDAVATNANVERRIEDVGRGGHFFADQRASISTLNGLCARQRCPLPRRNECYYH